MTPWLTEHLASEPTAQPGETPAADIAVLRAVDVLLSGLLMTLVALPAAWALTKGRLSHRPAIGRMGRHFQLGYLNLPGNRAGRCLGVLGAAHWPLLLNIMRGEMAFVGPRVRSQGETVVPATLTVRPGLINPWYLRRRTAVDFGTEQQADAHYLARRSVRHDLGLLLRGTAVSLLNPPAAAVDGRVRLADVLFDNIDMQEALMRIDAMLDGTRTQQVSFVNPACVNAAATHRGYRRALARVGLVLPDGIGIKIGGALLGTPLKQNVNGTDLFPRLCERLQERRGSVYLLGGKPGVAEEVAAQIARHWPGVRVVGLQHGYFSVAQEGAVVASVHRSGADLLLVAQGVPTQDLFIDRHLPLLGVKVAMGVGGLFDFVAGRTARAPVWMRETGLEWVFRLMQEPGRMWRRYLLGNFSFLGRLLLQRARLRRPANDVLPLMPLAQAAGAGDRATLRTVLFATARVPADLPVRADFPAALLPLGHQTMAEHVLDQLSRAGIVDLDVVVSDSPDALRATLGDGSRWGLRIRWHLTKDPRRPYAMLQSPVLRSAGRVLIGHAHVLLDARALSELAAADGLPTQLDLQDDLRWIGWASTQPSRLIDLGPDLDEAGLGVFLRERTLPVRVLEPKSAVQLRSAAELLTASFDPAAADLRLDGPVSWVRQPWGMMSPLARVHPRAELVGPVVVGPGCIVEAGACIGPNVVLSRDVVVSSGTRLSHSVVLADTFIGAQLDLSGAVVNGERMRHVRLGVEAAPAVSDALLVSLAPSARVQPSQVGRLLAMLGLVLAGPALACHVLWRGLTGQASDWTLRTVVTGRDARTHKLITDRLRCARQADAARPTRWTLLAGLLDVAAGRRQWIGMRPRSTSQWYALQPEWQAILAGAGVGLLHAAAWTDELTTRQEARAASDVFLAVQTPWRRAWLVLRAVA